ncbi:hypothetical protein ALC60_02038 [Trachymyrmex zeteki]|uniref:Uncharacterized protein n=1 Tax=Mycetomoellerius zeteki TaxID=64791 RepID=A0A151XES2_9HYME|nr:hypothetical protein ALC60_02038 [Trachymyrmex zeteki]
MTVDNARQMPVIPIARPRAAHKSGRIELGRETFRGVGEENGAGGKGTGGQGETERGGKEEKERTREREREREARNVTTPR